MKIERDMRPRRPDYPLHPLLPGIAVALGTPTIVLVAWQLPEIVAIYTDWRVFLPGLTRFMDAVAIPFMLLYAAWAILVGTLWSWTKIGVEPWQLVMMGGNVGALLCAFLIADDKLPIDAMTGLLFVAAAVPVMGAAYLLNKGHEKAISVGRTSTNPNDQIPDLDWYG